MMMLLKICAETFIVLLAVSPPNKVDPQKVGTLSDWRVFHFYIYICVCVLQIFIVAFHLYSSG